MFHNGRSGQSWVKSYRQRGFYPRQTALMPTVHLQNHWRYGGAQSVFWPGVSGVEDTFPYKWFANRSKPQAIVVLSEKDRVTAHFEPLYKPQLCPMEVFFSFSYFLCFERITRTLKQLWVIFTVSITSLNIHRGIENKWKFSLWGRLPGKFVMGFQKSR